MVKFCRGTLVFILVTLTLAACGDATPTSIATSITPATTSTQAATTTQPQTTSTSSTTATTASVTTTVATNWATKTANCNGLTNKKIGYSPLTMEFDYFQFTVAGMKQIADQCKVEVVVDDPRNDAAKQVSGIENLISTGVGSVSIVSIDPTTVLTGVDAAHKAKVSVISQVSTFTGADVYVGLPEHEFGRLSGDLAGKWLLANKPGKAKYNVVLLNQNSLGQGLLDRRQGVIDGFEQSIKNYSIVAETAALSEDKALAAMETIIQAHPDLDMVLCLNDPCMLGAANALKAAGKKLNVDTAVMGLGIDKRVLQGVLDGTFPGSVSPDPFGTGRTLVNASFALQRGEKVPQKLDVPPVQITKANAQSFIDELYPGK